MTKGAGSRNKGLFIAFQLLAMAERRWWRINGPRQIPLVRAGVRFIAGAEMERDDPRSRTAVAPPGFVRR